MTDMSPRAKEIAQHSLAWPARYRNYFAAAPGTPDYDSLEDMVRDGWAVTGKIVSGGLVVFHMTDKTIARLAGEEVGDE